MAYKLYDISWMDLCFNLSKMVESSSRIFCNFYFQSVELFQFFEFLFFESKRNMFCPIRKPIRQKFDIRGL